MILSDRILGTSTTRQLRDRATVPVLIIGRDRFARSDLASVQCFNYIAAANLSRALRDLEVTSTQQLFDSVPPSVLAVPRIGAIALAVLGAAFEAKGIGGSAPLEQWVMRHAAKGEVEAAMVTFDTLKKREAADVLKEQAEKRARQRKRRDAAHTIRVERHARRTSARAGARA